MIKVSGLEKFSGIFKMIVSFCVARTLKVMRQKYVTNEERRLKKIWQNEKMAEKRVYMWSNWIVCFFQKPEIGFLQNVVKN